MPEFPKDLGGKPEKAKKDPGDTLTIESIFPDGLEDAFPAVAEEDPLKSPPAGDALPEPVPLGADPARASGRKVAPPKAPSRVAPPAPAPVKGIPPAKPGPAPPDEKREPGKDPAADFGELRFDEPWDLDFESTPDLGADSGPESNPGPGGASARPGPSAPFEPSAPSGPSEPPVPPLSSGSSPLSAASGPSSPPAPSSSAPSSSASSGPAVPSEPSAPSEPSILDGLLGPEAGEGARAGLRAALSVILRDYDEKAAIGPAAIDEIVSRLDAILSERMDEALHHPDFVDLSKTWLSLKALTDRLDFQENVVVEIFNATLEELYEDFADVPELNLSTMFRIAYSEEYGQYGGKPFAAILGAYEFGDSPMEFYVLNRMSALGAMAHAPFIGTPGPGFFGMRSLGELSRVFDLNAILDEKRHENYRELRTRENSRYLALVLPGFLARLPHSPALNPVGEFNYSEGTAGDPDLDYVWGHSSFLLAARMARSFAKTGWYSDFVGAEGGGLVDDLPVLEYESMGKVQNRISTRLVIGEKLENQLSNSGFIPFVSLGNTGKASFNFAQTVLKPKESPADPRAAFNHRISTMLPNLMLINRLAHHIKVLQRENVGTWKDSLTLERELNNWLNQYVTDMDNPSDSIRAKRPLRSAKVTVTDLPDTPGWHSMTLSVRPHMKFLGADFTLTIQGRLDRADFPGT